MRVVACASPTHNVLAETWFLPTLDVAFRPEICDVPQLCPSGEFRAQGWAAQMTAKVGAVLTALGRDDEVLVFSDVDVRFFAAFTPELARSLLGDHDIAFQQGGVEGRLCAGFFVVRAGRRVRALFERTHDQLGAGGVAGDEQALNDELGVVRTRGVDKLVRVPRPLARLGYRLATGIAARRRHDDRVVSWRLLPPTVWSPGLTSPAVWHPGTLLRPPRGILVHHANYAVGVDHKLRQLAAVDRIVRSRR